MCNRHGKKRWSTILDILKIENIQMMDKEQEQFTESHDVDWCTEKVGERNYSGTAFDEHNFH